MGVWFVGDIDYKCPSFFEPSEFGCNTEEYTHYFFHKSEIDKIKSVIQKYKDLLKQFGIDASDMNMDILMSMGIDDIQREWNLKFEDALKVFEYLYSFCFGCEILYQVQENGQCHFYLPA